MADPFLSWSSMQEAVNRPMEYPVMNVEKLYEFNMLTFIGENVLKADKNCTLQNPILNYVLDKLSSSQ